MLMKDCTTCMYAVFDPIWGEYKCVLFHSRVYDLEERKECVCYKEDKEKLNKN